MVYVLTVCLPGWLSLTSWLAKCSAKCGMHSPLLALVLVPGFLHVSAKCRVFAAPGVVIRVRMSLFAELSRVGTPSVSKMILLFWQEYWMGLEYLLPFLEDETLGFEVK